MADLWSLVCGKPEIDPRALADAIEREAQGDRLDFRTRLLIRDATAALEDYWGAERQRAWLGRSPSRARIEAIRHEDLGNAGFPFIKEALVEPTGPETVHQYLRELGAHVARPVRLVIGGSVALILTGRLSRSTQDIDVVDEVPAELREQHQLLDRLARRYGLQLTHFQSHFLPLGWESRVHSLGSFGPIQAFAVDVQDIFLSKLFSKREKDLDDLRLLLPQLEREAVIRRMRETCGPLLAEPALRANAAQNWYVLTGQPLLS